jgi:isopenicillin-N N-acyltransferase-like protein
MYGEGAAAEIARSIAFYSSEVVPASGSTWDQITTALEPLVPTWRDLDAESIAEMQGIAEGAGVGFGDILALNCRGAFTAVPTSPTPDEGCTSFSVMPAASADGHQLTGQNWDYLTGIRDTVVLVLMEPDDGPRQLMIVEAGQVGRHGYNEAGVAIHANGLSGALRDPSAVPSPIWRRRALRQWNISDAMEAVLMTPRPGTTNIMMSHRDGFAVDLETTPMTSEALFPDEGWFVHTNHFIGPVPEPLKATYNPGGESLVRLGRAKQILGSAAMNGGIGIDDVKGMLRDHVGKGQSLCSHPDETEPPSDQWGTVASVVTDLTDGVMHISAGPPCENDYADLPFAEVFG